jgi:hypothetical protein
VNAGDPHVVELRYRVQHSDSVELDTDTLPLEREFDSFRLRVTAEAVTAVMTAHYVTEEEARAAVEAVLYPWEIYEAVNPRATGLSFTFEECEMVDRDPPAFYIEASVEPTLRAEMGIQVVRAPQLPELSKEFAISPNVEVMWKLYEGYRQEHDRLLPMAYTCLTRFTYSVGGDKRQAAKKYGISRQVLTQLASLSTSGDEATARKWVPGRPPKPLTDYEFRWVEEAVRRLILRAGQYAAAPDKVWPQITKAHLPTLPDEKQ